MAGTDRYYGFNTTQKVTLEKLLANAGGGSDLGIVSLGDPLPLNPSDMLIVQSVDDGVATWINAPTTTIVQGQIATYLMSLPGFAAGAVLTGNVGGDGMEWVAP